MKKKTTLIMLALSSILTACAVQQPAAPIDTTSYRQHMPKSILILPPINASAEVNAGYSFWSTVSAPVAEAGYYVFPMSIVDKMFKENGISQPNEAHAVSAEKLQDIFGADAALYIHVKEYGSRYQVLQSTTTVAAEAKLIDLKTGQLLWSGERALERKSGDANSGLVGMLASALVEQVISSIQDRAYPMATSVSALMFNPTPQQPGIGLLYGPRSPAYQTQP